MKPRRPPAASAARATGSVRIIGGRWRGSKLPVADAAGLRPSSDRVRETLFNWLMPALPGARVLDAYAGSGALGLEAVSRGAGHAVLVEREPRVAQALHDSARRLDPDGQVSVVTDDVLRWLSGAAGEVFDVVFLDPPFADAAWERTVAALAPRLAEQAWVYIESPAGIAPAVPSPWRLHREGHTRDVRYALYRVERPAGHSVETVQVADTLRGDSNEPVSA